MAIILYSTKLSLLKHWHKSLEDLKIDVYVTKTKSELFEYFNANKHPTILVMQNDLNDEKNEEFLALLKRTYTWVSVCILSSNPNLKEASECLKLGVRGYGNAYMYSLHVKQMVQNINNNLFWFYPDFLEAFLDKKVEKNISQIGVVSDIKNLVLANTNEEEHIVIPDEKIYENETFITPYENSFIEFRLANNRLIHISGNDCIYFDKTIYIQDDLSKFCIFDKEKSLEILSFLGEDEDLQRKKIIPKKTIQITSKEAVAKYNGNFQEYNIKLLKNMTDFLIIEDSVANRDGSDLINNKIDKFIFLDTTKTYEQLLEETNKL